MAEIRETQVTRDVDGNVVDRTVVERPKKKGGFGWGVLFGVVIIAGAIVAFAYNQGSFQTAGVRADQATQTAQAEMSQTADNARAATQRANNGNPNTNATDKAPN